MFPARIRILYLIVGVLVLASVVPLFLYSSYSLDKSRERLKTNERLLQNTITKSLSDDIDQRQNNQRVMLDNLSSAIQVASGGDIGGQKVESPELRALLERFVTTSSDVAFAALANSDGMMLRAGRIEPDAFLQKQFEHAFAAARDGRGYAGQPLAVQVGKQERPVMLLAVPIAAGDRFIGMLASVVDLSFLVKRLDDASQGGLLAYVVDSQGRLVAAAPTTKYATGQDMTRFDIVKNFVDMAGKASFVATTEFDYVEGSKRTAMLGSYSPVPSLGWAVIAQKEQSEAYRSYLDMKRDMLILAFLVTLVSVVFGVVAAQKITTPLQVLTDSSRAIAKGDFSQRVKLRSRTEIGELAETFNVMSADLEQFVQDLKRAAEENRALFMSSITMIAGAVDEKDPYTKGHSDRVTRYSVLLAKEMGLSDEEIETVRIAAQLHDVGKIGIEDRILKKPGALTPEEFEIMKQHTTKGAAILRPVEQLKDMIPGIELHHESLDGRGYPYGLRGDQIPRLPRIIMVADTFDAMTTNRPYQAAMDPEYVVRIINSLAATKFDPQVVAALTAVLERGLLKIHRAATVEVEMEAPAQAAVMTATGAIKTIETNRA